MLLTANYPNTVSALAQPAWGVMPNIQAGLNSNRRATAVVALAGGTASARIVPASRAPKSAYRVSAIVRVAEGVKLLGGIGVQYAVAETEEIHDWDAGIIETVKYVSVSAVGKQALYRVSNNVLLELVRGSKAPLLRQAAASVAGR